MITGAIAILILVVVLPPAMDKGETGVIIAAVVIAVLVVLFGMAWHEGDRAYVNFIDYWANGRRPENKRKQQVQRAGRVTRREAADAAYKREHYAQELRDKKRAANARAGIKTMKCFKCGGVMGEQYRTEYSDGTRFASYLCPRCGETKLIKF